MTMGSSLKDVIVAYLNAPSTPKDWRYYMVKYKAMRARDSGRYVIAPYPGYSICMLKGDSCDNRSYHSDAYLLAAVTVAQISQTQIANSGWPRCFPGYETESRSLELRNSGIKIRCAVSVRQSHLEIDPVSRHRVHDEHHAHYGERHDRPAPQAALLLPGT